MIVGYLCDGKFLCANCMGELNFDASSPTPIPVMDSNLSFYSQHCNKCAALMHEGKVETELFPTQRHDDESFDSQKMQGLMGSFYTAVRHDDDEAASCTKRVIYERILRAIMDNKLLDRDLVFASLRTIMEIHHRW